MSPFQDTNGARPEGLQHKAKRAEGRDGFFGSGASPSTPVKGLGAL